MVFRRPGFPGRRGAAGAPLRRGGWYVASCGGAPVPCGGGPVCGPGAVLRPHRRQGRGRGGEGSYPGLQGRIYPGLSPSEGCPAGGAGCSGGGAEDLRPGEGGPPDGILSRELRRRGGEAGKTTRRFLGSITHKGYIWRFDSVDALCPKVYELADSWELAGEMLARLHRAAADNGWDTIVCCAPEGPGRIEHLLIPGLGLAFVTSRPGMEYGQKPFRRVRLDAMTEPQGKARLRFQTRMAALLREEGAAALKDAKANHDKLEAVYNPYVDFDGVRTLAALEAGRLLSWLG